MDGRTRPVAIYFPLSRLVTSWQRTRLLGLTENVRRRNRLRKTKRDQRAEKCRAGRCGIDSDVWTFWSFIFQSCIFRSSTLRSDRSWHFPVVRFQCFDYSINHLTQSSVRFPPTFFHIHPGFSTSATRPQSGDMKWFFGDASSIQRS